MRPRGLRFLRQGGHRSEPGVPNVQGADRRDVARSLCGAAAGKRKDLVEI